LHYINFTIFYKILHKSDKFNNNLMLLIYNSNPPPLFHPFSFLDLLKRDIDEMVDSVFDDNSVDTEGGIDFILFDINFGGTYNSF